MALPPVANIGSCSVSASSAWWLGEKGQKQEVGEALSHSQTQARTDTDTQAHTPSLSIHGSGIALGSLTHQQDHLAATNALWQLVKDKHGLCRLLVALDEDLANHHAWKPLSQNVLHGFSGPQNAITHACARV